MAMAPSFDIVVAVDRDFGIGKGNDLPWKLPRDMKYFKQLTVGDGSHENIVIMGRKTWESLPPSYKPLPKRKNIVLTRQLDYPVPNGVLVYDSLDHALKGIELGSSGGKVFVIGGSQIYEQAIIHSQCQSIYLTQLYESFNCDTFFSVDSLRRFKCNYSSNIYHFDGVSYVFKKYIV